ncbi:MULTISPECIES: S9 family peptidase [Halobacterium]|uniref:S9 family peptidase n=1 Tax=Halobacterium TaxID=2239 RepID=UPI00073EF003|nr:MULTISPECIES: S9 family peptidase [Halobacterium]MCG1004354.1 S9 family peptidase [Halobacterium noricense]
MKTVEASDYVEFSRLSHPAVSPDGERVAYVQQTPESETDYEAAVHVAPTDGGDPKRFTVAEGVDSEPAWSPSGDRIAFVSTRGARGRQNRPRNDGAGKTGPASDDRPQLWVVPTDGGEAEQVTDVVGGVSGIAWGPEGEQIAFVQSVRPEEAEAGYDLAVDDEYEREDPDPRVIDRQVYRSHESYADGARSHVYTVDTDSGDVERVTEGAVDCLRPAWGETDLYYPIRYGSDDDLRWEIEAYDPESTTTETVTVVEGWGPTLAVDASRPHDRIAYTTTPEDDPTLAQTEIEVFTREAGDVSKPTETLDRDLELWNASHAPEWGPDGDFLYGCTPDEGGYVLRRLDPKDGSVDVVLGGDRHVHGFSVSRDAVGVVQSEWDHPGDVVAATPGGAEEVKLTRVNADYLDERAVREPEELRFQSGDAEIQGWVLTPPDFSLEEEYPLAVEVHGGPHRMWSTTGSMWHEFQTLAARGYVVFWCNPRGSTGYGESFMTEIERDWGDATMQDVMAGAREVAAREYVDEDDAFVTGGSFGGFMTSWLVGHTDFFAGAVAQRGVYDLTGFYGSSDAYKLVEGDFRAAPWSEPEFLREQSPAASVEYVDTPTLLMHAEQDYRTPANTAELFYRSLQKHDVDTRLVRYPREGHELSRSGEPGHVVDRIERIVRWFDGYSDHHGAERALDRSRNDGLTAGSEDDGENE